MKKLGEMVGLHESTISRYEKGEIISLDIEKMKEFARALDVNASWLMGWEDEVASGIREHKNMDEIADEIHITIPADHELGNVQFSEDEIKKINEYAKFLLSQRKE